MPVRLVASVAGRLLCGSGLDKGATEHATVVGDLLTGLRDRGLDVTGRSCRHRRRQGAAPAVNDLFDHLVSNAG
jgi:hypothetical protein